MSKKVLTAAFVMLALSLLIQGAGLALTSRAHNTDTQAPEGVQIIQGVATAKYIDDYRDSADMVITATDGTKWRVREYICPLHTAVTLTISDGEIIQAVATTSFTEAVTWL